MFGPSDHGQLGKLSPELAISMRHCEWREKEKRKEQRSVSVKTEPNKEKQITLLCNCVPLGEIFLVDIGNQMPLEHYDLYNVNCQTQPMMPAISSQLLLRGGKKAPL